MFDQRLVRIIGQFQFFQEVVLREISIVLLLIVDRLCAFNDQIVRPECLELGSVSTGISRNVDQTAREVYIAIMIYADFRDDEAVPVAHDYLPDLTVLASEDRSAENALHVFFRSVSGRRPISAFGLQLLDALPASA